MITKRGMNITGFTYPPGMKSNPSSISNNPNYNPALFGQGQKTDMLGRTAAERFGDYLRGEQLDYQKGQQEKIKRMTFNPLQSMYTSRGGRDSRLINQSMIGGMPAESQDKRLVRIAKERAAQGGKFLLGPAAFRNYAEFDAARRASGYKPGVLAGSGDGGLMAMDSVSRAPQEVTNTNPTFNEPKQLTERQEFNLSAFPQAKAGTNFANNSGFGAVISNSILGKTAGMQPPVNLSFMGSQY